MADNEERVLVTYDCLHYALLPTQYINRSISNDAFVHFANTAESDLLEHPASSHQAKPGKCPLADCEECETFAVLHSALSDRIEMFQNFFKALCKNYILNGERYHNIDPLIRARFANDTRCLHATGQYAIETRHWREDPFFASFNAVPTRIGLVKDLIKYVEQRRKVARDEMPLSESHRRNSAREINGALWQLSKALRTNQSITDALTLLTHAEKQNDTSFNAKQSANRASLRADYEAKKPATEIKQKLIPSLAGIELQQHISSIRKDKVNAHREATVKYARRLVDKPDKYNPLLAATHRMRNAWAERMTGFGL